MNSAGAAVNSEDARLLVERVGPLATIQDLGRPGWFDSGGGVSGAADRGALRLANRLVGNPEGHAGIEVLLGGLTIRTRRHTTLSVTGAPA
ncbi:allophanate hydrolase subunit 2 family protein, partial [Nocardia cyriacigeorgica]|nr:allophanate hydrolase subunit 2 family protein [Nocardia cyriacigeorgica]